jgi:tetratricopeptide (TPR) repeat protein
VFKKSNRQNEAKDIAHAGDIARDAKDWLAAVDHYEAYLTQTPGNGPIWVQLGNCAKEAGDYEKSLAAYQQALSLQPTESDTHLQLGHLNKLLGRLQVALDHYRTALSINPALADARHEIERLSKSPALLQFMLPPTFLDFMQKGNLDQLLVLCGKADLRDDPFRKYAELVNG